MSSKARRHVFQRARISILDSSTKACSSGIWMISMVLKGWDVHAERFDLALGGAAGRLDAEFALKHVDAAL